MATLTVQDSAQAGLEVSFDAAAGGGDEFANANGNTILLVNNGDGSPVTVTIVTQSTYQGLALADQAVVVAAGEIEAIGPFNTDDFNDSNGRVQVTYSGVTSLTVAAVKVRQAN